MRYKMVLSYSGAGFCGWQKQPGVSTVQETVENALYALLGTPTPVVGAGRTDTEVSAAGYVLHFDAPSELDTHRLRYKLNAILPRSVAVSSVSPAAEDFHARFGAVRREYTYFLHREKDPFADGWSFLFSYAGLDFDLMNRAAALLLLFGGLMWVWFKHRGTETRRGMGSGGILGLYLVGYAVIRFGIEYLRGDPRAAVGPFSISQAISIGMLIIGAFFIGLARHHR